jgi:hypothetical protein
LARTARTAWPSRPHPQSQLPRQARGRVGLCFSSGAQPPEGRPWLARTTGLQGREGRDRARGRVGSYGSAGASGWPGPAGTAWAGGAQGGEGGAWPTRGVSYHSGRLNFNNVYVPSRNGSKLIPFHLIVNRNTFFVTLMASFS